MKPAAQLRAELRAAGWDLSLGCWWHPDLGPTPGYLTLRQAEGLQATRGQMYRGTPVAKVIKVGSPRGTVRIQCPLCGGQHTHGALPGVRAPHCPARWPSAPSRYRIPQLKITTEEAS